MDGDTYEELTVGAKALGLSSYQTEESRGTSLISVVHFECPLYLLASTSVSQKTKLPADYKSIYMVYST